MPKYNPAVSKQKMPARFLKLPVDERGYPVPRFVEWIDGKPDFRVMDHEFWSQAIKRRLCWLCGEPLGKYMSFVVGPMCTVNRTSAEPPSHFDCAHFAVRTCPFLVHPQRSRNDSNLPEAHAQPAGIMLARNPGVTVIWTTTEYKTMRVPNGVLIRLGEPTKTEWFTHGRLATREEVLRAFETGLPALRELAEQEGPDAMAELDKLTERALSFIPPTSMEQRT